MDLRSLARLRVDQRGLPVLTAAAPDGAVLHVVAGALLDERSRVLVSRRLDGRHLAGLWEFPGGKLERGESREKGLARELHEELGVEVLDARPLVEVRHDYPDRRVLLDVWHVVGWSGEPHGREGQETRWLPVGALDAGEFPPADVPVIEALARLVR